MFGNMFDGLVTALAWACWIGIPLSILGVWKLVEIIIWLFKHVDVSLVTAAI